MFKKPKKKHVALRSGNKADDAHKNNMIASSNKRRRYDSSSDDEEKEETGDLLQQIREERENAKSSKRQLNSSSTVSKNIMHEYKSSNDQLTAKEMATRTAEHHPEEKQPREITGDAATNQSLPSFQSQPRNKFLAGPLKAPTFVRTTARFDYQPDICKDYKETGFCGFGDTCIYLHDRGDTKSGWEMEREYEEKKKKDELRRGKEVERFMSEMNGGAVQAKEDDGFGSDGEKDNIDDGIPFACHICRGPFKDPIVTVCNHYFCESCMSTRVKEVGMGCPVCQKDTHGVLNFPQKLFAKKRRLIGRDGTWDDFFAKNSR